MARDTRTESRQAQVLGAAVKVLNHAKQRVTSPRAVVLGILLASPTQGYTLGTLAHTVLEQGLAIKLTSIGQAVRDLTAHGLVARQWTRGGQSIYHLKAGSLAEHSLRVLCPACQCQCFVNAAALPPHSGRRQDGIAVDAATLELLCADCHAAAQNTSGG